MKESNSSLAATLCLTIVTDSSKGLFRECVIRFQDASYNGFQLSDESN